MTAVPSLILPFFPPREIVRHVRRDLVLELRRALFQERADTFLEVVGRTGDALRFEFEVELLFERILREVEAGNVPLDVFIEKQKQLVINELRRLRK